MPGKGNGAFALRDIKPGVRILLDDALMHFDKSRHEVNEADLRQAFQGLDEAARTQFMGLFVSANYAHMPTFLLKPKYDTNHFGSSEKSGCYAHASRFNHSCSPNCVITAASSHQKQCFVVKPVKIGEELTFAYDPELEYMTFDQRTVYFATAPEAAFNKCFCSLCQASPDVRAASDGRRKRLRELKFLLGNGSELSRSPPVFTRELREEAISLSTRQKPVRYVEEYIELARVEGFEHNLATRYLYFLKVKAWLLRAIAGDPAFQDLEQIRSMACRAMVIKREYLGTMSVEVETSSMEPLEKHMDELLKATLATRIGEVGREEMVSLLGQGS